MKIIFSRKGFDSSAGGVASPIFPDGTMVSLPIPGRSAHRYQDIFCSQGNLGEVVESLTKSNIRFRSPVHFDPDLSAQAMSRKPGWLPSLGQTGAAQSHLNAQGVSKGDVFVFLGWFRDAEKLENSSWRFVPGSKDRHVMFGYMEIGESIAIGARPNQADWLPAYPWLENHVHFLGERDANNTIHVAPQTFSLNSNLPGGNAFSHFSPDLVLSAPNRSRSLWRVPAWLKSPLEGCAPLSYHTDPTRWTKDDTGATLLQTVAKGQGFVIDTANIPEAALWLEETIRAASLSISPPQLSTRSAKP